MTRDLLVLPSETFAQRFPLPLPRGQVGFRVRPQSDSLESTRLFDQEDEDSTFYTAVNATASPGGQTPHQQKWSTQSVRWMTEVIPALVQPYLQYLQ